MKQIHKTIKSFLEKYDLNKSDLVYLVAFSGGFDSMCLLHALKKTCKNKIVAELNCKNFCQDLKIEFYSEELPQDVAKTETAAREARYKFFENCAKNFNSKVIFTAHNKNDNTETLIYRICTGTGIAGLLRRPRPGVLWHRHLLLQRYLRQAPEHRHQAADSERPCRGEALRHPRQGHVPR